MSASTRLSVLLAASMAIGALLASTATDCHAQYRDDFDNGFPRVTDYQWAEPVDIDLNRKPVRFTSGLWFNYNKLAWALTSERNTIGDPNTIYTSEQIYVDGVVANNATFQALLASIDNGRQTRAPVPYDVVNGIVDTAPQSEFGWGDRYEMGYVDERGRGIMLGVIDGNEVESEQVFGFGNTGTGFGSVHVNFRLQNQDLLVGFRDYGIDPDLDIDDDDDNFDGPIEETEQGPGVDGLADDETDNIDGDSVGGPFVFIDPVTGLVFFGYDFDDLHQFNIRFYNLGARNISQFNGVELMRTHVLDNRHWLQKNQNHSIEIGYGVRYFELDDTFLWEAFGDLGLNSRWFTFSQADNQIVGPQLMAKWAMQRDRLQFGVGGKCMLGYNTGDLDLEYGIGSNFRTGGQNNSATLQPTYGANGRQERTFSPVIELRAELKYLITRSLSVNVGYNAMFVDNITRASKIIDYTLPDIGLLEGGDQDVFINGVNFGVEYWH